MKIFLSQAMNGRSDEEIKKEINLAKSMLLVKYPDAEFIDSYITEEPKGLKNVGAWYLGKSLEMLAGADLCVYISDTGWSLPRGCRIEHEVCSAYDIPYANLWVQEHHVDCENTAILPDGSGATVIEVPDAKED